MRWGESPQRTGAIACTPHSRSLPPNRRLLCNSICLQSTTRVLQHSFEMAPPLQPSLPAVHNTVPNSALRLEDGSFAPAHMLPDARLERAGRQSKVERQVGPATTG